MQFLAVEKNRGLGYRDVAHIIARWNYASRTPKLLGRAKSIQPASRGIMDALISDELCQKSLKPLVFFQIKLVSSKSFLYSQNVFWCFSVRQRVNNLTIMGCSIWTRENPVRIVEIAETGHSEYVVIRSEVLGVNLD